MSNSAIEEILASLVAIDTTSSKSNLRLIDFVRSYLAGLGVESELIFSADRQKANLWAAIGAAGPGGLILSGHTDCVPVDGQDWTTDPFTLSEREGRLYGRGTADMKGFLACVLAAVPDIIAGGSRRPVHIAFSYDEEIGHLGVRGLTAELRRRGAKPGFCVVGEPTMMGIVIGHKGGRSYRCRVTGSSGHSSLAPRAVNAIEYAAELITEIRRLSADLATGPIDTAFDVSHSTISTGLIEGGSAINMVPHTCSFVFEYRNLIAVSQDAIFARIERYAKDMLEPRMKAIVADSGISFEPLYDYPAHEIDPHHPEVLRVKRILGRVDDSKVAYGTEAGAFSRDLGVPTVICGPGSIAVAHKADEAIEREQLQASHEFIVQLAASECP
ncbi:MAG: acetylornithine deacetylase [Hyphomicrobiales bacterium]|nr:acetylornithine deacetylase [Hyphomicrobiales bacterium]